MAFGPLLNVVTLPHGGHGGALGCFAGWSCGYEHVDRSGTFPQGYLLASSLHNKKW